MGSSDGIAEGWPESEGSSDGALDGIDDGWVEIDGAEDGIDETDG